MAFAVVASFGIASAQTNGDWVSTAGGTQLWATPTNWSSDPNIPGGVGSEVAIESNITAATSIDLESTDRTVGILSMGDAIGTSNFAISSSAGGALVFERVGGAQWNVNQGGSNTISSGVTLNSDLTVTHNNAGQNVSLTGVVSGTGGITQNGTGRVFIQQANTFEGGYTLNSGTVAILNAAALGTGTLTLNGGTLEGAGGSYSIVNSVNLGGHITRTGASSIVTFGGPVTLTTNSRLTTDGRLDISADIQGAFSLAKDGPAMLNLYGTAKSFSGGFTLDGGEVLAQINQAFGSGTIRLNSGIVSSGGGNRTYANALELAGEITLGNSSWGNGNPSFSGSTTLISDTTLNIAGSSSSTLSGNITGNANLIKTGASGLILRGENSYTGYTEVQDGILSLFRDGNVLATGEVRVTGGTLNVINWDQTIGSLVVSSGAITDNDGNRTLSASSFSFTDSGTVDTRLGGSGALTKSGNGVVTLNRANGSTYSGGTAVNAGTLLVNNSSGSGTGSGVVTVASGAVLGGDGIITGATTISGSLQPGNSIGTLTISNDVTWNAGDAWVFELGTSADSLALAATGNSIQDQLVITGAGSDFLSGSGDTWVFDFAGGGETGWYELITWSGSTTFAPGDFLAANLADGLSGNFAFDDLSSGLYLQVIPEPSTIALVVSGFVFGFVLLLRRRANKA